MSYSKCTPPTTMKFFPSTPAPPISSTTSGNFAKVSK